MLQESDQPSHIAAEASARRSYGKLVAILSARMHDVDAAEDALSEAFASALSDWPVHGVPINPEAWLLTAARRKMIDNGRRQKKIDYVPDYERLISDIEADEEDGQRIPDDRLRLMFACAHPAIEYSVRAPLMLQTILGFDAVTIASSFLVSPTTISQRLVRAKSKIRQAGIPFRVPERADMDERLVAVLDAIYAVYTVGWSDPAGTDSSLRNLAAEGVWLGRLLASLLPEAPEALGLLSLMLYAESRRYSRRNARGEYVPLADQNTKLWDVTLIEEAEELLQQASRIGTTGRYQLEAAIQSAHTVRRITGVSDWGAIEGLYGALHAMTGSPVVAINRAIAVAEARDPSAGLALLDLLADDFRVMEYQPYWAARAELLTRIKKTEEAVEAYQRAIGLESDPAVRHFLQLQMQKADNHLVERLLTDR